MVLVFNTASSKQLDAKFAAATLCGLDLLAIGSRGRKKMPLSWSPAQNPRSGRRGNVVISIFKRQRFRLLDRDHSRIGFAGNDRHGAFMMVSRPRRANRACTLCPCPERPCCRRAAEQRDELAPFQLAARNLLLDRANAAIAASRIGSPAMGGGGGGGLGGLGGGGCGGLTAAWGSPLRLWPPRRRRWRIRSNDAIPFSAQGVWAHAFGRDPPLAGPA